MLCAETAVQSANHVWQKIKQTGVWERSSQFLPEQFGLKQSADLGVSNSNKEIYVKHSLLHTLVLHTFRFFLYADLV